MKLIAGVLIPLFLTLPMTSAVHSARECVGTGQTADIHQLRIYRSVDGGSPKLVLTKDVRGQEGRPATVYVDPGPGATFHATVTDTSGNESCPSATIFVEPVDPSQGEATVDRVVEIRRYDVHGRLIGPSPASGVYWEMRRYLSGRTEKTKWVHLR
jgi:hypothetical protein